MLEAWQDPISDITGIHAEGTRRYHADFVYKVRGALRPNKLATMPSRAHCFQCTDTVSKSGG